MPSLREALSSQAPAVSSAQAHAARIGFSARSLRELILASDRRTFTQNVSTPPGTALGGWVRLDVAGDGRYTFTGHMHGSGFDPYRFSIHAYLQGTAIGLTVRKTGSVGGTFGGGSRDFDWTETGQSAALKLFWTGVRDGNLQVVKSYDDTGVLGAAVDVGMALGAFVVAASIVGMAAGLVVVGSELAQIADIDPGPGLMAGVLVAGGVVLLCGPSFVIPAVIAGVAAGTSIRHRHLTAAEEALARQVFAETLVFSRIRLTDLESPLDPGRAFATSMPDGTILVNLGGNFDGPIANATRRTTFIHELVHAWQTIHGSYDVGLVWQAAVNKLSSSNPYDLSGAFTGQRWEDLNIEAQASAVAAWYFLFESMPNGGLESPAALQNPLYGYVANHIRLGAG